MENSVSICDYLARRTWKRPATQEIEGCNRDREHTERIRNEALITIVKFTAVPTLYVGAKSLPKGAQVETQVVAHTGMYTFVDSDDGTMEVKQCDLPEFEEGQTTYPSA